MKEKKYLLGILLVSLLALFLRLYRLGEIPISLHWDEASWGYNAFSILKTGRDEYGKFMPLIFKAFGDFKAPVYVYLTSLSIAIFGLNEFAIRFPATLFGAIDVFLLYFFTTTFFFRYKQKNQIALFSSLILTLSPWHYHFSHGAWEANILLAFYLLGLILFLKSIQNQPRLIFASVFFFGLCFYVYNAAKLILPLTFLGLLIFFVADFFKKQAFKKIIMAAILFFIFILPVSYFTFFKGAGGRLEVMSIFSYPRPPEEAAQIAEIENTTVGSLKYFIFNNNVHYFFRGIFLRYLNHFSPLFLFFKGDWSDYRHGVPDFGVLNYLDCFLLISGAYYIINRKILKQGFIWYWLAIAPLPAALSRDIIQSLRAYLMVFPLAIISAFGLYHWWQVLSRSKKFINWGIKIIFVLAYLWIYVIFWDRYFVHTAPLNSAYWQYGYKQAVEFIKDKVGQYQKVVFTNKYGQPYIYYLLYSQYDPKKYQSQAYLVEDPSGDVGYVEKIDNLEFRNLFWPRDRFEKGVLYVGASYEIPVQDIDLKEARILKEIYFLNGELAFRIVETLK